MLKLLTTIIALLFLTPIFAQDNTGLVSQSTDYNLDFERVLPGQTLPDRWGMFNDAKGYKWGVSNTIAHSGTRALEIEQTGSFAPFFACVTNAVPAKYLGKEIEFKAWMKLENAGNFAAIMIRIDDANGQSIQFRSLEYKKIKGTKDWAQYSVKCPMPEGAQMIYPAVILGGAGKLWIDDGQLLIDGKDISQAKINLEYDPNPPKYGSNKPTSGIVKLKDANIYYETYGSGEPLLLLHGNSGSIRAFAYQIGPLAKHYKVIAVDTRGQGRSTDQTTGALSYNLFADDTRQLMDSLHIKKADILGWSDGGNTGLIMAVKYPSYVNKLAVMGANLFPTTEAVPDSVLQQIRSSLLPLKYKSDAASKMRLRLTTLLITEPHLTFDEIKTIKCPVLVMAGEHDIILDSHTRAIAAAIPKAKLVIFKGATHYAPYMMPKWFNGEVLSFF